jgi:hypothetical protein
MNKKSNKVLLSIIILGLILRVTYVLFFADMLNSDKDSFRTGDTYTYVQTAINLVDHGTYRTILEKPESVAGTLPAYPLFISITYLLSGHNVDKTYQIVIWLQLFLDVITIFLIYRLTSVISKNTKTGLVGAFLYALYPFTIFWISLISSETLSLFFLILGFLLLVLEKKWWNLLLGGFFIGMSLLCRPQMIVFLPIYFSVYLLFNYKKIKRVIIYSLLAFIGFTAVYGSWITRNYIMLNKIVLFKDVIGGFNEFDKDITSFRKYIYSMQDNWEPQLTQILTNQEVEWPAIAYISAADSLMLRRAEFLSKNCGSSFSHWHDYWNKEHARIPDSLSCNDSIAYYFNLLRKHQIEANPKHYNWVIPIQNVKKALFKNDLTQASSNSINILSSLLFIYRSFLLLIGFLGVILMIIKKNYFGIIIGVFFIVVYYYICFKVRNTEMRYFLNNDVLLLIPAAWFLTFIYDTYLHKLLRKS